MRGLGMSNGVERFGCGADLESSVECVCIRFWVQRSGENRFIFNGVIKI